MSPITEIRDAIDDSDKSGVLVRPMRSSDLAATCDIHFEAFAGYLNTRLGVRYVHSFLNWFRQDIEGVAIIAEEDGRIVGYTVGAPVGYGTRMNRGLAVIAALGLMTHPWALFDPRMVRTLFQRLKLLMKPSRAFKAENYLPQPCMSLVGIGVSPTAQGCGVGSTLMKEFECIARARRMRSLRLSVYAVNTVAITTYSNAGWKERSADTPGMLYFYKVL